MTRAVGNAVSSVSSIGKQKQPKAPDAVGAAREQAAASQSAAREAAAANRVNQVGPWGSLTYNQTGTDAYGNPTYTATQGLPDELQGGLNSLFSNINQSLANGLDLSSLPQVNADYGQQAQDAIMSRLTPQFDRRQQQLETQLANQGIAPGTEAWKNAFSDFNTSRNDAEMQAVLQGIGVGQSDRQQDMAARQQALQEQSLVRSEPLSLLQALRQGTQITPYSGGGQSVAQTPDLLAAQNANYQNQVAGVNAQNAQTSQLLNTGLMAYAF